MKKNTGYIVLAVSGSIYIIYNLFVTGTLIYLEPGRNLNVWQTALAEFVTFIPLAIFFIFMLKLSNKKRVFFESLTLKSIATHIFILAILIGIHSVWQVYFNSKLISGAEFSLAQLKADLYYFLNLRVLIYVITVGLIIGIKKLQERENYQLEESKLKLELQKANFRKFELKLNPEIIYPNLDYIREHAQNEPENASKLVLNLSMQMRILIDNLEEERILIRKDLEFYKYYFEGLQVRLGRTLSIQTEVSDSYLDLRIPSLVLLVPFFEKLFFGNYSDFSEKIELITYRSNEDKSNNIDLSIDFYPIKNTIEFSNSLSTDDKLKEIQKLLKGYEKSSLEPYISDDRLTINLNMVFIPGMHEEYSKQ